MKRAVLVALSVALVFAACGGGDDGEPSAEQPESSAPEAPTNEVEIGLTEYEFEMPDTIEGGVVTLAASNTGGLPHEMAFGQIEGDHDIDDVMKALQGRQPPPWFTDVAGIPLLSPGVSSSMTRELDEGRYVFLCFLPTPEGQPHALEGMVKLFEVEGTSDAELPEAHLSIAATDEGFEVPDIPAGTHSIELTNEGQEPHEFALYSLEPGMTEKDINKWFGSGFKTDVPALFPGGLQSVEPGTSIVVEMTFEAGRTYTLEDFEAGLSETIEIE